MKTERYRVVGIDPGSRVTGYGVIDWRGGELAYVASGCVRTQGQDMPSRLGEIYSSLCAVFEQSKPTVVAIEEVFVARNVASALKLGQARGVAIAAAQAHALPVAEYAARSVKQAIVGTGRASKAQVAHMVKALLKLQGDPQADAADALAIAICHVNTARLTRV